MGYIHIYSIKYYFSRHITISNQELSESKIKKGEKGVWQRRYWEHTIRNEKDLYKHLDYIHFNPIKHNLVKSLKDYKYSTFTIYAHALNTHAHAKNGLQRYKKYSKPPNIFPIILLIQMLKYIINQIESIKQRDT